MNPLPLALRLFKTVCLGLLLLGVNVSDGHSQGGLQVANRHLPGSQEDVSIRQKLTGIILPNVEFRQTALSDALEFLRQESRRLDPDPDPQARGVNLILQLPTSPQPAAASPGTSPPTGTNTADVAATNLPTANTRITLTLSRIPLLEALKYLASQAGLKIKVEPHAVSLVPLTENTDQLITATFRVSPNFIGNQTSGGSPGALNKEAAPAQ